MVVREPITNLPQVKTHLPTEVKAAVDLLAEMLEVPKAHIYEDALRVYIGLVAVSWSDELDGGVHPPKLFPVKELMHVLIQMVWPTIDSSVEQQQRLTDSDLLPGMERPLRRFFSEERLRSHDLLERVLKVLQAMGDTYPPLLLANRALRRQQTRERVSALLDKARDIKARDQARQAQAALDAAEHDQAGD